MDTPIPPVIQSDTEILRRKHDLRIHTFVIVAKFLAHFTVGVFTPWAAALAQWANSETWPGRIIWVGVILPASAVGGASAVLSFLSGSFKTYQEKRREELNQ